MPGILSFKLEKRRRQLRIQNTNLSQLDNGVVSLSLKPIGDRQIRWIGFGCVVNPMVCKNMQWTLSYQIIPEVTFFILKKEDHITYNKINFILATFVN